jgi:pyruvate kinase
VGKPQADLSICGGVLRARSHEYHKEVLDNLREASRLTGKLCAVLLDTKGPEVGPLSLSLSLSLSRLVVGTDRSCKRQLRSSFCWRLSAHRLSVGWQIRTGTLVGGTPVMLEKGTRVTLTNDYSREGDALTIPISYQHIARDLQRGSQVRTVWGGWLHRGVRGYTWRSQASERGRGSVGRC